MNVLVILFVIVFLHVNPSYSSDEDKQATILLSEYKPDEHGYKYKYQTSNGIERSETGIIEHVGKLHVLRVSGHYMYKGTDGKIYLVNYIADEKGYRSTITISSEITPPEPEFGTRIGSDVLGSLIGG